MTIDDVTKLKSELDANVLKQFQDFEAVTGLKVGMFFDHERDYKQANKPLLSITLTASM